MRISLGSVAEVKPRTVGPGQGPLLGPGRVLGFEGEHCLDAIRMTRLVPSIAQSKNHCPGGILLDKKIAVVSMISPCILVQPRGG